MWYVNSSFGKQVRNNGYLTLSLIDYINSSCESKIKKRLAFHFIFLENFLWFVHMKGIGIQNILLVGITNLFENVWELIFLKGMSYPFKNFYN